MARENNVGAARGLSDLPAGVRTALGAMMLRRATNGWAWRQVCIKDRKAELMARKGQR